MILNSVFEDVVVVNTDECFDSCEFKVRGASKKDSEAMALKLMNGHAIVKNCKFANKGYSAINVVTPDEVVIENCVFECDDMYNPIEGGQVDAGVSKVDIKNCTFNGQSGNNYINFYRFQENAEINLSGNVFPAVSSNSEVIRISNMTSANVTYNVDADSFYYMDGSVGDYTSYIMCQDYTAKKGTAQDFSKVVINLKDVKCNGKAISANAIDQGMLTFTYQDGSGIIAGNQPVINFK